MKTANISDITKRVSKLVEFFHIILLHYAIFFYNIFLTKRVSKFIQSLTDYELRGIKVNFKRHLALLYVVSRCPTPLFSATLSGLAISVAPLSHVRILPVHPSVSLSICLSVCLYVSYYLEGKKHRKPKLV